MKTKVEDDSNSAGFLMFKPNLEKKRTLSEKKLKRQLTINKFSIFTFASRMG